MQKGDMAHWPPSGEWVQYEHVAQLFNDELLKCHEKVQAQLKIN